MELSAYELAWISGGFSLLGVLVGGLSTYRFALHLQRAAARREAGRRLREAFAEELAVGTAPDFTPDIAFAYTLQEAFPKHSAAVRELAVHLNVREREALDAAWREYWEVGGSMRFFDYYMGENPKQLFEQRVRNILECTDT